MGHVCPWQRRSSAALHAVKQHRRYYQGASKHRDHFSDACVTNFEGPRILSVQIFACLVCTGTLCRQWTPIFEQTILRIFYYPFPLCMHLRVMPITKFMVYPADTTSARCQSLQYELSWIASLPVRQAVMIAVELRLQNILALDLCVYVCVCDEF